MFANGGDVFPGQIHPVPRCDQSAGCGPHSSPQCSRSCKRKFIGHEKHFVDGFAWPIAFAKFFDGQKINCAAQALTRARQEVLPLFIRGDTQDGGWHDPRAWAVPCMRQAGATALPANKLRGLYPRLTGGKQKLQERADALGPGGFVVLGALHAFRSAGHVRAAKPFAKAGRHGSAQRLPRCGHLSRVPAIQPDSGVRDAPGRPAAKRRITRSFHQTDGDQRRDPSEKPLESFRAQI